MAVSASVSTNSRSAWSIASASRAGRGASKCASLWRALRRLVERVAQRRQRRVGIAGQLLGEQLPGAERALAQFAPERRIGEQAFGERQERVRPRRDDRRAPEVDLGDRARQGEARQQAGAQQRGFARAARPDDEQERPAIVTRASFPQPLDRLGNGEIAAEEHDFAVGFERCETRERRAVQHPVPDGALRQKTPPCQPLAQALLDLSREIVGRDIGLERRDELAAPGSEPGVEKALQPLPLRLDFGAIGRIERDRGGFG